MVVFKYFGKFSDMSSLKRWRLIFSHSLLERGLVAEVMVCDS